MYIKMKFALLLIFFVSICVNYRPQSQTGQPIGESRRGARRTRGGGGVPGGQRRRFGGAGAPGGAGGGGVPENFHPGRRNINKPYLPKMPVIGIFTYPTIIPRNWSDPTSRPQYIQDSYIAGSNVNWVESGGANVVPIPYSLPKEELKELFGKIQGLYFPGAMWNVLKFRDFYTSFVYLMELAIDANERGDYFPVWGTCLGLQMMLEYFHDLDDKSPPKKGGRAGPGGTKITDCSLDANGKTYPLFFYNDSDKTSKMYSQFPPLVIDIMKEEDVGIHLHNCGVLTNTFFDLRRTNVSAHVDMTTYNICGHGKKFVSTIEHKVHPIYALGWHPEKALFEDHPRSVERTTNFMFANNVLASFFVSEAKKSRHRFASQEEFNENSIYTKAELKLAPDDEVYRTKYYLETINEEMEEEGVLKEEESVEELEKKDTVKEDEL